MSTRVALGSGPASVRAVGNIGMVALLLGAGAYVLARRLRAATTHGGCGLRLQSNDGHAGSAAYGRGRSFRYVGRSEVLRHGCGT